MRIILASSSPRRKKLLDLLGIKYEVIPPRVQEDHVGIGDFGILVENIALRKATEVYERTFEERIVIGADTIVVYKGEVLGKPSSKEEAKEYLNKLSGDEHYVYTGVAFVWNEGRVTFHERTRVWFRDIPPEVVELYVKSGSPMDKAGAYGIQDLGAAFVRKIEGDFYTVMGLPIGRVWEFLWEKGFWK